jgi:hypothetical protein
VIRHTGKSYGTKKDRVIRTKLLNPIFRHHAAGISVSFTAPGELIPLEFDVKPPAGCFKHPNTFRNHLFPYSITRNHRNPVALHTLVSSLSLAFQRMSELFIKQYLLPGCRRRPQIVETGANMAQ